MRHRLFSLPQRRPYRTALAAILLFAFAIRIIARAVSGPALFWKNSYLFYFTLAQSIASGQGYSAHGRPATFRVPFYPIYIAAVTRGREDFWSLLIAQALVSTGTAACAAALAWRFFGRREALVAAALTALYPYYLWHDTSLQETGLLTFLTALGMVLLFATERSRSLILATATGLVFGLTILTRSIALPFSLVAILWLLLPGWSRSTMPRRVHHTLGRRIATAGLCLAALTATLSPWLMRNHDITGRWTLGTEFGSAVFYGNNPETFAFYPQGSIDASVRVAREALTPADTASLRAVGSDQAARSDWFLQRGLAYIRHDPGHFLIAAVRKNFAAFGVLPSPRHGGAIDVVEAASYGAILLLGLIGLWHTRQRWRELLPVYAQFVCFAGITGLLWGHSSHRAFLDVYLIVFAASVLVAWAPRLKGLRD